MTDTVVFLLNGTTSWPDPGDTTATNHVEALGSGGSGAAANKAAGGGGGEYRRTNNITFSFPVTVAIGAGGGTSDTTFASTTVVAKPGGNASGATAGGGGTGGTGAGGNANGGAGGSGGTSSGISQGGGGGAGGPSGAGQKGGNGSAGSGSGGAGGGGSNGGTSSAGGNVGLSGATGTNGGNGTDGTGGGATGTPGAAGTSGKGAGGGGGTGGSSSGNGGNGSMDAAWDGTHGCGGGGGGQGGIATGAGGNGSTYGGGGGGAISGKTAGVGANGLIAITYTPSVGITLDAASNSTYQSASSSYSWSHTCTGNNRFLAVDVAMLSLAQTVTDITYNGVSLELIGVKASVSGACRIECWGMAEPSTGSNTIVVTLSGSIASAAAAVSYAGVNQNTPYEAFNSAQATNVGAADATVTITTVADNDWVHAAVATDDASITSNNTSRNNVTGAGGSGADSDNNAAKTPAGNVVMGWTNVAALATWAIGGYGIRPVAASNLGALAPFPWMQTSGGMQDMTGGCRN